MADTFRRSVGENERQLSHSKKSKSEWEMWTRTTESACGRASEDARGRTVFVFSECEVEEEL